MSNKPKHDPDLIFKDQLIDALRPFANFMPAHEIESPFANDAWPVITRDGHKITFGDLKRAFLLVKAWDA